MLYLMLSEGSVYYGKIITMSWSDVFSCQLLLMLTVLHVIVKFMILSPITLCLCSGKYLMTFCGKFHFFPAVKEFGK